MTYESGEATIFVEGKLFEYDFENYDLPNKEDIEKWNTITTFSEYVSKYAKKCGYKETDSEKDGLVSFVGSKCKEAGVSISRQTLNNWLKEGLPANTSSARENVYRLCFALEMNAIETKEFFLKAYLERPFNYKNINEAVYFFCLKNGYKYDDALRLIKIIEAEPVIENDDADEITEVIGEQLSKIDSEKEFLNYIFENRSGFAYQNKTGIETVEELIERCKKVAGREYYLNENSASEISVTSIDELLKIMYGYSARGEQGGSAIHKQSISESNFPKLIKRNWPQREQFQNILKKKTASYDVIRKALILLTFYDFAANAFVESVKVTKNRTERTVTEFSVFDELTDEINLVLAKCGYVHLYWRNPFDWMIGYCAQSIDPLGTFRNLIDEYYLSIDDVEE